MNKETEETVIDSFDRIYDKAIDHSIETVDKITRFHYHDSAIMHVGEYIISQLYKLKSDGNNNS